MRQKIAVTLDERVLAIIDRELARQIPAKARSQWLEEAALTRLRTEGVDIEAEAKAVRGFGEKIPT